MAEKIHSKVLSVQTFGGFELQLEDGSVYRPGGKAGKLWRLFKFLLVKRRSAMTPEQILDALYPEEDFTDPKNVIQNLVYRLRKLLAAEGLAEGDAQVVLYEGGGYRIGGPIAWELDCEVFDSLLEHAAALRESSPAVAAEDYFEAIGLYKGAFLAELAYEDWVYPLRVYYSDRYVYAVLALAELLKGQGRYKEIARLCEEALGVEAFDEEINLLLIESYIMLGRMVDARERYDHAVRMLEKQYGLKPTRELVEIGRLLADDSYATANLAKDVMASINEGNQSGAFYCSLEVFMSIYELERRRQARNKMPMCPVYVDFAELPGAFDSPGERLHAVSAFRQVLLSSLRQGDVVAMSGRTRFLILLPQLDCAMAEMVLQRIFRRFNEEKGYGKLNLVVKEARLGR